MTTTIQAGQPDVLTQALAFHKAGCCPIPAMNDGSKAPVGSWKKYQTEMPAVDQITTWFQTPGSPGMGLVCGAASGGLELLEFEGRAAHLLGPVTALMEAAGLGELWARIVRGYTESTPGGGLHFLIRVIGMPVPGNKKLARRPSTDAELAEWKATEREKNVVSADKTVAMCAQREAVIEKTTHEQVPQVLIETRGEGGFVIVAPSNGGTHPTGKAWVLISGGPSTIPTITAEEHEALHEVMRTFDEMPKPAAPVVNVGSPIAMPLVPGSLFSAPSAHTFTTIPSRISPADDYNSRTTWPEILVPLGWVEVKTDSDGTTYWRRPGKSIGISATTRVGGGDGLWVFSTSTEFEAERSYTKFGVYALLHHGDDFSAAARDLRARGYGTPTPSPAVAPWTFTGFGVVEVELPELDPQLDWEVEWAQAPEDVDWLCEPLFERGRSYSLYSPPKAGKSLLLLEIAAALATGRAVLGNPPRPPVSVVYVDQENSPADLVERLIAMGYEPGELGNLHYISFPSMPPLDVQEGAARLLALARRHQADIVILDTVSRMVEGKENDSDTYLALYRLSLVPLKALGICVVRLDHSGKNMELGQRGSSAKSGDVDAVWRMIKRVETESTVIIDLVRTDSRSAHGADAVTLTRRFSPLRHDAVEEGGPGPEVSALAGELERLGIPKDLSRDKVRALLAGTGVTARNGTLSAAIKHRKMWLKSFIPTPKPVRDWEGYPQGKSAPDHDQNPSGNPGTDFGETAGQTSPGLSGTAGDSRPTAQGGGRGDKSPPLRGGRTPDAVPSPSRSSSSLPICEDCDLPMSYDDGSGFHVTCGPNDREDGDS